MSFRYLNIEREGQIATIQIGDPNDDRFIADGHPMHRELRDVFPLVAADESVVAAVITGTGSHFCPPPTLANLDALLSSGSDAALRLQLEVREIVSSMIAFHKPLVAAVSSEVLGMGAQIALLCDFVVALRSVRFRDTHVRLGLTAGDGGTVVWPLVVGLARARRLLLGGHAIEAEEAHRLGVVTELVEDADAVLPAAQAIARKLSELPQPAYSTTKLALNRWLELGASTSLDMAMALQIGTYESDEFRARREKAREQG